MINRKAMTMDTNDKSGAEHEVNLDSLVSLQDFQNWLDAMPKGGTSKHIASCVCVLLKQLDYESLRDVTNRSLCAEREKANRWT